MMAFDYPPRNSVGVQRTLRYARHLPESGWQGRVLTARVPWTFRGQDVGGDDTVRTPFVRPFLLASALAWYLPGTQAIRLKNWFALPDLFVGWWPFAASAAAGLLRSGQYEALYSTSPPVTTHLAALQARRDVRMPWIADFRDAWVDNPVVRPATRFHARLHADLERRVVTVADAVVVCTDGHGERLRMRYPDAAAKITVIPNGYDEEEFSQATRRRPADGLLRLVYAGSFLPQYDPDPLFEGVAGFLAGCPDARSQFRLRLLVPKTERSAIDRFDLASVVEERTWRPPAEVTCELMDGDALLLYQSPRPNAAIWVPAKTYPYLRAGRPILAVLPPGNAARIVEQSGLGYFCRPGDPASIADGLARLWKDWVAGKRYPPTSREFLAQYDGRMLSRRLGTILDQVTGSGKRFTTPCAAGTDRRYLR